MQLIGVEVQGFRRFGEEVSVRLLESLIAVVGQNEAGKTSFLEALEKLNNSDEIPGRDQTRRLDTTTEINATFELEEEDWNDLNHIDEGGDIEKCTLTKHEDGDLSIVLDPKPSHDLRPRQNAQTGLDSLLDSKFVDEKAGGRLLNKVQSILEILDSDQDYLGKSSIDQIQETASDLEKLAENTDSDSYDTDSAEQMATSLRELVEHETDCPPKKAKEVLLQRRPQFLIFDEEDRNISSTYDLKEEVPNPPKALANLAKLADLDLEELKDATVSENIALRDDLLEEANEQLKAEFSEAWVRDDVFPDLSADGTVLHINVRTPGEQNRSPIDQRSDGLLWYVALLAFLNKEEAADTVLLVDEAESHLSYDAQAELVEVLETQEAAQKVVYTTHSAGCLPSDLGRGIRPVIQGEGERSDIKNGFWTEGPGFKPIMGVMGLGPLAFSVARNAIIAEGPSETILLPTLIRQTTEQSELGYQVAPGASNVGDDRLPELLSESGRSVILLDGDDAGEETKEALIDAGANSEKVKTYGDFTEEQFVFEDLLAPEQYAEAVNEELRTWQEPETELDAEELPEVNQVEAVKQWCQEQGLDEPMKPNICQRLAEKAAQETNIVDSEKEDVLSDLHNWAEEHFIQITK